MDERTALSHKLKDALKIYYPQIPAWFDNLTTERVTDLLENWPTLRDLKKVRPATVEKFSREHGLREEEKIQQLLTPFAKPWPLRMTGGDRVCQTLVAAWVPQLRDLQTAIAGLEKAI